MAGEQSYARALAALAGPVCEDGYCFPVEVVFVREPRNQYDGNAFRAEVNGQCVGYMRRHIAAQLAGPLDRARVSTFAVCGLIRGGSREAPTLGVHIWLDRTLTSGLNLALPPVDDEWEVPWPPGERAQVRRPARRRRGAS